MLRTNLGAVVCSALAWGRDACWDGTLCAVGCACEADARGCADQALERPAKRRTR